MIRLSNRLAVCESVCSVCLSPPVFGQAKSQVKRWPRRMTNSVGALQQQEKQQQQEQQQPKQQVQQPQQQRQHSLSCRRRAASSKSAAQLVALLIPYESMQWKV